MNELTASIKVEDFAQNLGISKSLIRFWEEEFGLTERSNGTMTRLEAEEISLINDLVQVNNMTLEDAKEAFSTKRKAIEKRFEMIEKLSNIRKGLLEIKGRL